MSTVMTGWVLNNLLVPVLISVPSVLVTAWLALRRFRTQWWWERKCAAYNSVISSLAKQQLILETWAERMLYHDSRVADARREQEMNDVFRDARDAIRVASYEGAYILSDRTAEILHNLVKHFDSNPHEDFYSQMTEEAEAIRKALTELRKIAKQELGIR